MARANLASRASTRVAASCTTTPGLIHGAWAGANCRDSGGTGALTVTGWRSERTGRISGRRQHADRNLQPLVEDAAQAPQGLAGHGAMGAGSGQAHAHHVVADLHKVDVA